MKKNLYCHFLPWEVITKLLTIMRVSFVLLFICTFSVSASVLSNAQTVTLNVADVTIRKVFDEIEKQTGFKFFYIDEQVDVYRKVTLVFKDEKVEDVLNELFDKKKVKYKIFDNNVAVLSPDVVQPAKVTGKVVDAKTGEALPGVSVQIEGTTTGAITDVDGKYSIDIPGLQATLVISYVGYIQQKIPVEGQSRIDFSLVPDIKSLEEVVVVGYGTQKRRDVTSAVASFNTDNLDERPLVRVDQALIGQMAGVQVKQTTGALGKPFSVNIRGAGSISAGNEPLYVIDGFPLATAAPDRTGNYSSGNPLDNINSNDIESIMVLKDASAAAIYGSRAANGVVLITTKRGKTGQPHIGVNSYVGFTERSRKLDMLNASEWIDRSIEIINAQWVASSTATSIRTSDQTTDQRRAILGLAPGQFNTTYMIDDRWLDPNHPGLRFIDWQDEAFRRGIIQNYQVSASGGTESVKYYVSGNFGKQQGMVIGTDYTSFSARANVEVTASKKLKFGINLTPTYSINNDPGVEGKDNILHQMVSYTPVQEDTMGLYPNFGPFGQYKWSNSPNSPIAKLRNMVGQRKIFRTITSTYAELEVIKGLNLKTTVNLDNTDLNFKTYVPYTVTNSLATRNAQLTALTSGTAGGYKKLTFVNENTISYHSLIADKHDISLLAGASYNIDQLNNINMTSTGGYNSNVIETLNAAVGITGVTGGTNNATFETQNVLLSYFGRVQYSFDSKYLMSASIRRDGSSRFGVNTKWGYFPSASIGWRMSEEKFMKNVSPVSDFKLRASWGKAGNYNIGDYASIPTLGIYNYTFNSAQATGQTPASITNPDLTWETSETFDAGLDLGLLKNRITASFDYYTKLNSRMLLNVPIPQSTGFPTYLSNAGQVRNRGWEIELTTHNLTGNIQWTTTVNLSHNTNKVVSLAGGQNQIFIPSNFDVSHSILQVGQPIYSIYVVRQIGILTQQDLDNHVALFNGTTETVGDPKYFDANNDQVIDANDRVIVGHPNPDYIWGMTNTFKFKGFDLTIMLQGQRGGSIYSLLGRALGRTGQGFVDNALGFYRGRWRSPDDPGAGNVSKAYSTFGRIVNTDWLYSSDYWRVRNITLGYDIGKLLKIKGMPSARIYITAENWFGFDKYKGGFNPEATNTDLSGSVSYPEAGDYGGLPIPRSLILGLNVTF